MQLTQSPSQSKNATPSIGLFLLYIFATAALIIFIGYPKFTDWRSASKNIVVDAQTLQTVQSNATAVKSQIGSVQPTDVSKINTALPATPDLADLYAQIESLANAANVHIVSIQGIIDADAAAAASSSGAVTTDSTTAAQTTDSSGNPIPVGPIKIPTIPSSLGTVSLNVDVSGNYPAIEQFLNALYTSLRITTVQQTVMTTGKTGATTGGVGATSANAPTTVDLKAQMQTYYTK
jgi:hypothetical protein